MDVLASACHGEVLASGYVFHGAAFDSADVFHDGWVGPASGDRSEGGYHGQGVAPEWTALGAGAAHILAVESVGTPFALTDCWKKKMYSLALIIHSKLQHQTTEL